MAVFPIFKDKISLTAWIQETNPQTVRDYCKWILTKRKREKGLRFTPTQVELRSLPEFPSYRQLEKIFGNFYKYAELLGFENKYKHYKEIEKFQENTEFNKIIYIDSREQIPLRIDNSVQVKGLKYGDYSLSDELVSGGLVVERKSMADFIGTISGGYERFLNELERAREDNAHLVILVEDNLTNALTFNNKWVKKFTKAHPSFIWHRVREIIQNNPHCQFVFSGNRPESTRLVKKLLFDGKFLKDFDIQLLLDIERL